MNDELADLAAQDRRAIAAAHEVTERASELVSGGVPLVEVCDVLHIDRHGWYRRLDALAAWKAGRS